jgi:hypothetical protein
MDTLGKLFGSKDVVKILRLFILNPEEAFDLEGIVERTKTTPDVVRTEINTLKSIGFVKTRSFFKENERKRGNKVELVKKRASGFVLNSEFQYLEGLQQLLAGTSIMNHRDLLRRLGKTGKLKLVVLAGVFVRDLESRLDLLLVGDRLRRRALENSVRDIEAELGKEIRYAAFATDDFLYRLSVRDRLIRDALDFTHDTVVDRLGIEAGRVRG